MRGGRELYPGGPASGSRPHWPVVCCFFFVVRPFLFDPDPIGTLSLLVGFGRLCFVVHVISSCLLHTVDS